MGYRVDGLLRLHQQTGIVEAIDSEQYRLIQPFTLDINEAWVEARGDWLDVRVGQQQIAWGVADGMNPVNVVNPYDLRDPMRFDKRLGTVAATARLHHKQAAFEVVYVPLFRPARLPEALDILENADSLFDFSDVGGGDIELGELETRTTVPDNRIGFNSVGLRASVAAPWADLAVVFYTGKDSLPNVGGESRLVGFGSVDDRVDVGIPVVWPSVTLAGLETRAPLFWDIAGWVEGALVLPQELVVTSNVAQLESLVRLNIIDEVPDPVPRTVIQDGRPYVRSVVGLERFFGRVQVNAQWLHGLPTERSAGDIRDYGALAMLFTISDTVKLTTRGTSDFTTGVLAAGQLDVLHGDALTITVGGTFAIAPPDTALGQLTPLSNVHLGTSFKF